MSKKLIASTLLFLTSIIIAVLSISLDRIDRAKIGGGYENGVQIDRVIPINKFAPAGAVVPNDQNQPANLNPKGVQ